MVPHLMEDDARFNAKATRKFLVERGINKNGFVRYCYRPFDVRWLYWEPETKLLDEKRAEYKPNVFLGNVFMVLAQRTRKGFEPPAVTSVVSSYHVIESVSLAFPIWFYPEFDTSSLFDRTSDNKPKLNLTEVAKEFLADLRLGNKPEELFYHTLAVLHAPEYCAENSGALRQDWPRVPLPKSREALLASAELGRQVAALLDTETPVDGVTKGKPRAELKEIAELSCPGKSDLKVTAGWGHAGQNGVTMPGKGRVTETLIEVGPDFLWPEGILNIYLNEQACWEWIP
jgi:predicted helicase